LKHPENYNGLLKYKTAIQNPLFHPCGGGPYLARLPEPFRMEDRNFQNGESDLFHQKEACMKTGRKNRTLIIAFSILVLLLTSGSDITFSKEARPDLVSLVSQLQNGDLVFRRGRSVESHAVLITDQKGRYSHVGIIHIENGEPFVIHAVPGENGKSPDFIRKEKITHFLSGEKASDYAVYRSDFSGESREAASRNAFRFYTDHLIFDNHYDLESDSELYCTELVIKAFNGASAFPEDIKTTELNFGFWKKRLILPGNLIENPHFIKIFITKNYKS
jgi:hypothetical protein